MDKREQQDVPQINIQEATIFPVLKDKVAIVTGAAMGMGRATAIVSSNVNQIRSVSNLFKDFCKGRG